MSCFSLGGGGGYVTSLCEVTSYLAKEESHRLQRFTSSVFDTSRDVFVPEGFIRGPGQLSLHFYSKRAAAAGPLNGE